jgi:hypothetical protein
VTAIDDVAARSMLNICHMYPEEDAHREVRYLFASFAHVDLYVTLEIELEEDVSVNASNVTEKLTYPAG